MRLTALTTALRMAGTVTRISGSGMGNGVGMTQVSRLQPLSTSASCASAPPASTPFRVATKPRKTTSDAKIAIGIILGTYLFYLHGKAFYLSWRDYWRYPCIMEEHGVYMERLKREADAGKN